MEYQNPCRFFLFSIHDILYFFPITVSAPKQAWDSIFQNEFMGGVQFKISLKKWTFEQKSGVIFKKNLKNMTFYITTWGSIEEWACIGADTVMLWSMLTYTWAFIRGKIK